MKAALAIAAVVAALGAAGAAHGQGETLPADQVARVADRPIPKTAFDHWMDVAAVAFGRHRVPDPGTDDYLRLSDQVIGVLLGYEWIEQEAAERHIAVPERAVRRSFRRQKRQAFRHEADYRRFLRRSHQTEADLLRRVRVDLLTARLQRRAIGDAKTERGRRRRLDRYTRRFERRWKARTVCGQDYATDECGRTVPNAAPAPTPPPAPTPATS
jgi:hypothetical protein